MRLVRQLLTEHLVLSLMAGTAGLLLAVCAIALRTVAAGALPRAETIHLDAGVLLFLLGATLVTGLLAGLLPAMQLSMTKPVEVLAEDGARSLGGRRSRRIHQGLVVAEIALAVVLLAGAGLLIRSFLRVQSTSRGFDSRSVLLLQVDLPGSADNQAKRAAYFNDAIQRLRALPGVEAAGAISDFFIHRQPDYRIALEGRPPGRLDDAAPPPTEDQPAGLLRSDANSAAARPVAARQRSRGARRRWSSSTMKWDVDSGRERIRSASGSDAVDPNAKMPGKPLSAWSPTCGGSVWTSPRFRACSSRASCANGHRGEGSGRSCAAPRAICAALRALDPVVPPGGVVTAEQRLGRTVALRKLQTFPARRWQWSRWTWR